MSQRSTFPVNDAFEAAVIADCDNDLPRLVYADWLDENGDPDRASFIRVQCELDAMSPAHDSYDDLKELEGELLLRLQSRYLENVNGPGPFVNINPWGVRGFPSSISVHGGRDIKDAAVKRYAKALRDLCETTSIRHLFLQTLSPKHVNLLLNARGAELLRGIDYRDGYNQANSGEVVETILASRAARHLHVLDLYGGEVNGENAKALAKIPFARLRRLSMGDFPCPSKDAAVLFTSPAVQALETASFDLHKKNLSAVLQGLSRLPSFRSLSLRTKQAADPVVLPTLSAVGGFESLAELALYPDYRPTTPTPLPDEAFARLAGRDFPSLRSFDFHWDLTPSNLAVLTTAPWFKRLRRFHYVGNLGADGFSQLVSCGASKSLRHFAPTDRLGSGELNCFTRASNWPELTSLRVIAGNASAAELAEWFKKARLPKLRSLRLFSHEFDDACVAAFASNSAFANLRHLHFELRFTGTSQGTAKFLQYASNSRLLSIEWYGLQFGQSAEQLLDKKILPQIVKASLRGNDIPDEVKDRITQVRPEFDL